MGMKRGRDIRELCLACQGVTSRAVPQHDSRGKPAFDGILNINKPSGMTSHDVVDRIRRAAGIRRVGHAGTLDPAASGVLLVCLGQATRVSEYLMDGRKGYDAQMRLGVTTDTGDAEGRVLRSLPGIRTPREQVEMVLASFEGRVEQVPPMYSALKHKGRPLYELARQGIEIERAPREVEIYNLAIVEWTPPSFRVLVECSRGTYVRALAMDIGEALGTGAHLERLVRVACGSYSLDNAVSLEEAERSFSNGRWSQILHPTDEALLHFEAFIIDPDTETRVRQGQHLEGPEPTDSLFCRTYSASGEFVALLQYNADRKIWRPRKVFNLHEAIS
jgi:tRNA pseudouridine55 synthase